MASIRSPTTLRGADRARILWPGSLPLNVRVACNLPLEALAKMLTLVQALAAA